ncbi:DUF2807 domain-containing protein [Cellulophaga sp. F20128]|uniref:GIN domain-containing protein n=1 Tax=Cellulophaga sp. F20128 TaxID=2926413 RepID=UPI001FF680A6|nr:DUF2807 domain-containing protein [Cellulophaga sp. F20128]
MKNIILGILLLSVTVSFSQKKPKIKGSKVVIEVNEVLQSFTAIKLLDDLKIEVMRSRESGYYIHGDDNLMDVLKFDVKDSTLYISSFYKITSKKKLDIVIHYEELNTIMLDAGSIDVKDAINTDYLEVQLQGNSKLVLNAQATEVGIVMAGSSDAEMTVDCDVVRVKLDEKSGLKLYATVDAAQLNMNGNTAVKIEGAVSNFDFDIFGNAQLKAEGFQAAIVNANLKESADAKIFVGDSLNVSAKGASKTYLYGTPKITVIDFLDTAQLLKKE